MKTTDIAIFSSVPSHKTPITVNPALQTLLICAQPMTEYFISENLTKTENIQSSWLSRKLKASVTHSQIPFIVTLTVKKWHKIYFS